MHVALALTIILLLTGCASDGEERDEPRAGANPVQTLVNTLSASPGWGNGAYPVLDLPVSASTDQVIARVFQMTGSDKGRVTNYRILETRLVRIGNLPAIYMAALVDTDLGRKIVLLKHYEGAGAGSWWSRVYDAD